MVIVAATDPAQASLRRKSRLKRTSLNQGNNDQNDSQAEGFRKWHSVLHQKSSTNVFPIMTIQTKSEKNGFQLSNEYEQMEIKCWSTNALPLCTSKRE